MVCEHIIRRDTILDLEKKIHAVETVLILFRNRVSNLSEYRDFVEKTELKIDDILLTTMQVQLRLVFTPCECSPDCECIRLHETWGYSYE